MSEPSPISLAYLSEHPAAAARALESVASDDVAALLSAIPPERAAPALAETTPWRAGQYLARLAPQLAAAIVTDMPSDRRTPCLRCMDADARERVLGELRGARARALRRQIQYPPALVGGVMEPVVATVRAADTVADAIEALRGVGETHASHLTVVDGAGRVAGSVAFATLLAASNERTVGELMEGGITPLNAETPLTQVVVDRSWDAWPERPVVDDRGRVIGRVTLARVLLERRQPETEPIAATSAGGALVAGYTTAVTGLVRVAADLLRTPGANRHGR